MQTLSWSSFWFGQPNYRALKIFRIVFGTLALLHFLAEIPNYSLRFTHMGLYDTEFINHFGNFKNHFLMAVPEWSIFWVYTALLTALIFLISGVGGRFSAIAAFLLHLCLKQNSGFYAVGFEILIPHCLLYLALSGTERSSSQFQKDLASVGVRLFQIQICIIYLYSFKHKMEFESWRSGEALWLVVQNKHSVPLAVSSLIGTPPVLKIISYLVLWSQLVFPFMIWIKKLRPIVLGLGVLFHLGTIFFLFLPFVGLGMISTYVFFLHEKTLQRFYTPFQRQKQL